MTAPESLGDEALHVFGQGFGLIGAGDALGEHQREIVQIVGAVSQLLPERRRANHVGR